MTLLTCLLRTFQHSPPTVTTFALTVTEPFFSYISSSISRSNPQFPRLIPSTCLSQLRELHLRRLPIRLVVFAETAYLRNTGSSTLANALKSSDILKIFFAIVFPPLGVLLERGCGADLIICILLTILGYIPGIVYALCVPYRLLDKILS
jgi:uncharacterized membrane protein YqaE (UPF0057 family)